LELLFDRSVSEANQEYSEMKVAAAAAAAVAAFP
jgi:hypothetical protein